MHMCLIGDVVAAVSLMTPQVEWGTSALGARAINLPRALCS
jgi:hypothetical protein